MLERGVRSIWARTALVLAGTLLLALVLWQFAGPGWGLAALAGGLMAMLGRHLAELSRLLRWLADPAKPVPEGRGTWEEAFEDLHRHVSHAREREQALSSLLLRFRNAVLAMPDGVTVLDADNHIEWCNPTAERDLGIELGKDAGQPIVHLMRHPDFVHYLAQGQFHEPLTLRLARRDGAVLSLRIVPYGRDQKLLLSRDITQAERLETMRRDFVANVSHELKTPITVLTGFLEMLADGQLRLNERRGREAVAMMQDQAARMSRLIEDLLRLSSLEASAAPSEERPVSMEALLGRLLAEAQALSAGAHSLTVDCAGPAELLGSEAELHSAFANIVSNAVRYTPSGGSIRVSWRRRGESGAFGVSDTGVGIDARHIPRLTERFYRVDSSRSRESGGTGLGLAIVKHVLARHQATLEIESEPGRGSCFSAVFPARRLSGNDLSLQPAAVSPTSATPSPAP
ncbi:MAG: phosphate regulon sensor histidine kinase PhoR [Betaproteobacteria bacterium RIFCSPLOWO2_12_FULL_66_14]|nr:MAG: phosphate regulon sensor histidine kinase PhoR [Betaproteobacteria bacterium RIFCSPLOWO2_12_FULL_66_14]